MTSAAVDERVADSAQPDVVPPDVRAALTPQLPSDRLRGWIVAGVVTAIAAVLRFVGITHPKGFIFDEVYYAQDAHHLLNHAVEWDVDQQVGSYVAHPPFGKWCIAVGEWIFGYNELGWRTPSAVAGVVSVLLITLLARRLTGSTILGGAAGLLMAVDGLHLVLSRVALLDIFLMLFLVAGFYCLVKDRAARRLRWLRALELGLDPMRRRPAFQIPWWRISAGVMCGLAMGVKWSALWFIVAFLLIMFVWEWQLRRTVGTPVPILDALLDEIGWLIAFGMTSIVTYVATWTGWFATDTGSYRHWLAEQGSSEYPVIGPLYNLWQYHLDVLDFHEQLNSPHAYQSWPWQWILDARPVVFFWSDDVDCGAKECASEVLLLGTPLLWWLFVPALIAVLWWGLVRRDWRAGLVLTGAAAGLVPWLFYPDRTMFFFYALPAEPFLVLAVVFAFGLIIGPPDASVERRLAGSLTCAGIVVLIMLCFSYFWPIFTGQPLTQEAWDARMWLDDLWV